MEPFIVWSDKYNTGNFVIDYQHQRLVRLINDLDEVLRHEELRPSLLKVILDEVANYTLYHFQTEEEIMEKVNYSAREEHVRIHKSFIQKLDLFVADYKKGATDIDRDFCLYLKNWLMTHIATEDPKIISEMSLGQGVV